MQTLKAAEATNKIGSLSSRSLLPMLSIPLPCIAASYLVAALLIETNRLSCRVYHNSPQNRRRCPGYTVAQCLNLGLRVYILHGGRGLVLFELIVYPSSSFLNRCNCSVGLLLVLENWGSLARIIDKEYKLTESKFFQSSAECFGEQEPNKNNFKREPAAVNNEPSPSYVLQANRIYKGCEECCQPTKQLEKCDTSRSFGKGPKLDQVGVCQRVIAIESQIQFQSGTRAVSTYPIL